MARKVKDCLVPTVNLTEPGLVMTGTVLTCTRMEPAFTVVAVATNGVVPEWISPGKM